MQTVTVPAASRFNVGPFSPVPCPCFVDGEKFGVLIESTVPIAVERAMYSHANGVAWAAGTSATGTRIP